MYTVEFTRQDRLAPNFTVGEALISRTADERGISNVPVSFSHLRNLIWTAGKMQEIRGYLDHNPVRVTSWYRNPEVNRLVGGTSTSSHLTGLAVDFDCAGFGTPREVCKQLILFKRALQYDQLILEALPTHTIIHIGFAPPGFAPRLQELFTRDLRTYTSLTREELEK